MSAAPHGSAGHPADLVGVPADDGPGRAGRGDRRGGAGGELRRGPAARALPGAVRRQQGPGRARVHPRPAADHQGDRRDGRRRGQAADRLRLPRADDVVPGGRHADGGADRERGPGRAGPVLRRDDRDPGARSTRWRRGRGRRDDNPLAQRAAHGGDGDGRRVGARVPAVGGGVTRRGWTGRRSTGRRCGGSTARTATGTWSARARRRRRSRSEPSAGRGSSPGGRGPRRPGGSCPGPLAVLVEGASGVTRLRSRCASRAGWVRRRGRAGRGRGAVR